MSKALNNICEFSFVLFFSKSDLLRLFCYSMLVWFVKSELSCEHNGKNENTLKYLSRPFYYTDSTKFVGVNRNFHEQGPPKKNGIRCLNVHGKVNKNISTQTSNRTLVKTQPKMVIFAKTKKKLAAWGKKDLF